MKQKFEISKNFTAALKIIKISNKKQHALTHKKHIKVSMLKAKLILNLTRQNFQTIPAHFDEFLLDNNEQNATIGGSVQALNVIGE